MRAAMADEWVPVGEASRRLNLSPSTIRRMIEAGQLEGERQVIGGSRERFLVRLDASETPQDASEATQGAEPPPRAGDASVAPYEASATMLGLLEDLREMRRQYEQRRVEYDEQRAADASRIFAGASEIADLRERVGRAESLVETMQALRDQWSLEANQQLERALRAESEAARLRERLDRLAARKWWKWW